MANKATHSDFLTAYAIMREETDAIKDDQKRMAATQILAEELVAWADQQIHPKRMRHDAAEALETDK